MDAIYCYSYVEDAPSAEVLRRLVETRNTIATRKLHFFDGFPSKTGGCSALKSRCPSFVNMAKGGLYTVSLADLDKEPCAGALIRQWFKIPDKQPISLPKELIFRVAIREIESWIIADHNAWARFIGIPASNFSVTPDELRDPKLHLLNVIKRKGRKKFHKDMLPRGTASIGPLYNEKMCEFIQNKWNPERAQKNSPSLKRAIHAINNI
ncbi:MAG: hypothetical protein JW849_10935 [Phycisphaerae bacterium]|nr:hypothetical protein [Phycisphaerae bacterium]